MFEVAEKNMDGDVQTKEINITSNLLTEKNHEGDSNLAETVGYSFQEMKPTRRDREPSCMSSEGGDVMPCIVNCNNIQELNAVKYVDPRNIQSGELSEIINRSSEINPKQKLQLLKMINKYLTSFTTLPGKCRLLKYKFHVKADQPLRSFSRPVPFAMRHAVKTQIQDIVRDDILELYQSDILNPLTVVPREGKKPHICVDARKVNQYTIPDYERTPPLQELLQRFESAKFISSLDLNSAFLQK
jgi:hypothetical protein